MTELVLDIGVYGQYARGSALADYVEAVALTGMEPTAADLETAIRKGGWYRLNRGMFTKEPSVDPADPVEDGDGLENVDDPDWHLWTFAILAERLEVLGDLYPFELSEGTLKAKANAHASNYVRLLALTMAHAYRAVDLPNDPRMAFERVLVQAIQGFGFASYGMGTATTKGRAFPDELAAAATAVGLVAASNPNPSKQFAKDAGVDAIGVLRWGDKRPGQVVLIAQATIAESDRWEAKIAEPKVHHWVDYLSETLNPLAALAVPHHIEREHFRYLMAPSATILDRLRLVPVLTSPIPEEAGIVEWLLGCEARL